MEEIGISPFDVGHDNGIQRVKEYQGKYSEWILLYSYIDWLDTAVLSIDWQEILPARKWYMAEQSRFEL